MVGAAPEGLRDPVRFVPGNEIAEGVIGMVIKSGSVQSLPCSSDRQRRSRGPNVCANSVVPQVL
jgi:hypothetical protein